MVNKAFFDAVKGPLYRGRLSSSQVDGLTRIVEYGMEHGYSRVHLAYILATAHHETGRRMQPIREGFARTNEGAIRAVTSLFSKGIIRTNYALPDGPYKHSYYGRGLIQITWHRNYVKMSPIAGTNLEKYPDRALEWQYALPLLFIGMRDGLYTGRKLPSGVGKTRFPPALRAIVNGDVKRNGRRISEYAEHFYTALEVPYAEQDLQAGDRDGYAALLGLFIWLRSIWGQRDGT